MMTVTHLCAKNVPFSLQQERLEFAGLWNLQKKKVELPNYHAYIT